MSNYKMFGFFRRKKEVEKLKQEVKDSFEHVKKDFSKVGQWITYIDGKHSVHEEQIAEINKQILAIKEDLEELKQAGFFMNFNKTGRLFKQAQTAVEKQTAVEGVQTAVQTAVQTGFFSHLTLIERSIVWALINSELKLSYEDLAALLGKDKSTIRGQINALKQKSEGLIHEIRESNGKKRLYIPEKSKEIILKSVKVRVKSKEKTKKNEESG